MSGSEQDRIDLTMMYATHHAFRRDLDRLIAAATNGKRWRPESGVNRRAWFRLHGEITRSL
jgi:hypothetical protein